MNIMSKETKVNESDHYILMYNFIYKHCCILHNHYLYFNFIIGLCEQFKKKYLSSSELGEVFIKLFEE